MLHPLASRNKNVPAAINSRLSTDYHRWFEITKADTPALQEKAFRLRFQVYCCEHKYETAEEHPNEMETDAFDSHSIHSLIVDRTSGTATGTVRLILPDQSKPEESLPIQSICNHPLPIKLPSKSAAEVSRFTISKTIRRMVGEGCPKELKCSVILGLMRATVQMSREHGVTDWFAIMEPSLLRLLCRFGIYFMPIGPLVEYHGFRQPCHANLDALLENVRQEYYDLWRFVTEPNTI